VIGLTLSKLKLMQEWANQQWVMRIEVTSEKKAMVEQHHDASTRDEKFSLTPAQETEEVPAKSAGANAPTVSAFTTEPSGLACSAAADPASKTDSDLNEGFPIDDGNQDEPAPVATVSVSSTAIHQPSPVPFSVSTISKWYISFNYCSCGCKILHHALFTVSAPHVQYLW
jgi:hypothetical protein